ncbi:glycoside hydrolase family 16 protein [Glonium stellatum]|uniref:Glycoside hydrolase family 16 protein n=1 Tax=Glonium stellatum TaxID=574774 RepID=A0A8E2JLS7_9PEZI|nr:glycoside hydrolase family 16 protein [Glonium stellatum]
MSLVEQGLTQYTLVDDYSYQNFFSNFNLITSSDPTLGFVQYQSLDSAISNQYIGYLNESVYLGVDHTNKTPNGRPSLRLEGKKAYNQGLLIADITHMPDSTCGNWPALWMFSDPWPEMGEIDIIEGVNQQSVNAMTLHTSAGCVVENATVSPEDQADTNGQLAFSGQMTTLNCDVDAAGQAQNVGCSIQAPKTTPSASVTSTENLPASPILPTYGTNFNLVSGSFLVLEPYQTTSQATLPTPVTGVPHWPISPVVSVTSRPTSRI